jgi:hypothetical protein
LRVRQRWDEQKSEVRSQKPEENPQAPADRNGGPSGSAALRKQKAVGSEEKEAGNSKLRIQNSLFGIALLQIRTKPFS